MVAGRYALIIANAVYEDSSLARLRAPSHDAEALRLVLEDESIGGFDVRVVADAGMRDVQLAVVDFFGTRRSGDLALLHFSGHGLKDPRGDLYFAARDTELRHLRATGVASTFVNVQISDCAARRVVVMLDCCYSGAFAKGALSRADRSVNLAEEFRPPEEERGKGRVVLTASSSTQYAFDGDELSEADDSPSVFTTALVEGLQTGAADLNEDGEISVEDVYEYVYNQVRRRTPYQVPQKHSFAIEGELVIAHSVRPLEFPHDLRANLESASVAARLEAIGELQRWLASPKPARRTAARTELQWRQHHDDSLRVRQEAEAALAGAAAGQEAIGDRAVSKPASRESAAPTDPSPEVAAAAPVEPIPPTAQAPGAVKATRAQAGSRPSPPVSSEPKAARPSRLVRPASPRHRQGSGSRTGAPAATVQPSLAPADSAPRPAETGALSRYEGPPTSLAAKVMLVAGLLLAVVFATLPVLEWSRERGGPAPIRLLPEPYIPFELLRGRYYGFITWLAALFATYTAALVVVSHWRQHSRVVVSNMLKAAALVASVLMVMRYFEAARSNRPLLAGAYASMPLVLILLLGAFRPSKLGSDEPEAEVKSRAVVPLPELATLLAAILITVDILFLPWERLGPPNSLEHHATASWLGRIALLAVLVSGIPALGAVGQWLRESSRVTRRNAVAGTVAWLICIASFGAWWKFWASLQLQFPIGFFLSVALAVMLGGAAIAMVVEAFRKTPST